MKNKIITVCIILVAVLSFMSFTAVLTQMDPKGDVVEETVVKAPEVKKAILVLSGTDDCSEYQFTFFYHEGMTWEDWFNSEYNIYDDLGINTDGYVAYCGYRIYATSDLSEEGTGIYSNPVDNLGLVKKSDLISHNFYAFDAS